MIKIFLRTDGLLVPIAIQLGQNPGPLFPIWTPKDEPLDWLLAKVGVWATFQIICLQFTTLDLNLYFCLIAYFFKSVLMFFQIWFKNGDVQVHQVKFHLALTHLFLEPFAIALYRCLPPVHPIFKMLREHLHYAIAINVIGRQSLISEVARKITKVYSYFLFVLSANFLGEKMHSYLMFRILITFLQREVRLIEH